MEPQELPPNGRKLFLLGMLALFLAGTWIVVLSYVGVTPCGAAIFFGPVTVTVVIAVVKRAYGTAIAILVIGLLAFVLFIPAEMSSGHSPLLPCANSLKQIGLALLQYESVYRQYPPAFIADAQGKPMHSWRVLLLPYLDHDEVYKQYRFDEPWDGPNNRKLHNIEIPIYHCPGDPGPKTMTSYVAVTGPETAWPGSRGVSYDDIKDGMGYTILAVEMAESGIHWMEPRDLPMVGMPPRINDPASSSIRSKHPGGVNAVFADGAMHFLDENLSWRAIRALLTVNGGEGEKQDLQEATKEW